MSKIIIQKLFLITLTTSMYSSLKYMNKINFIPSSVAAKYVEDSPFKKSKLKPI